MAGLAFQARKLLLELLDRRDEFGKPLLFLLDDHGWRAGDVEMLQVIDDPAAVVEAIFTHYHARGFELSPSEREAEFAL